MSELLLGETLVWVSYDRSQVFSAALKVMLESALPDSCRLHPLMAGSLEESFTLVEQNRAGLITLALTAGDEPVAMRVLRRLQLRNLKCVRCAYFPEHLLLDELRLREAGAQIVAKQIPWLQEQLYRLVALAPRRTGGNHPLTTGLVDRLPWKEV